MANHPREEIVSIEGSIPWQTWRPAEGSWIAVCEPLKLTVSADTWKDLMEDIGTTLELLFEDLLETGTVEQFLKRHGWVSTDPLYVAAQSLPRDLPKNVKLDIPFIPEVVQRNDSPEAVFA